METGESNSESSCWSSAGAALLSDCRLLPLSSAGEGAEDGEGGVVGELDRLPLLVPELGGLSAALSSPTVQVATEQDVRAKDKLR